MLHNAYKYTYVNTLYVYIYLFFYFTCCILILNISEVVAIDFVVTLKNLPKFNFKFLNKNLHFSLRTSVVNIGMFLQLLAFYASTIFGT